jgi:transcription elongation GreA/GreB family factor
MNKALLIEKLEAELRRELETLSAAARTAHEAATHAESRAEDRHDTRGLEASYLAGAQAARAAEIERQIQILQQLPRGATPPGSKISSGTLVELESGGIQSFCLLSPTGGGLSFTLEGVRVQVITPQSPLGEALLGSSPGETIELEAPAAGANPRSASRTFKIVSIA